MPRLSDTVQLVPVAPIATFPQKNAEKVFIAPPGPVGLSAPQPSIAEQKAAEVLEAWQAAETDAGLRMHLEAWESLRWAVDMYRCGEYPHAKSVADNGSEEAERGFAAVRLIAELFPLFVPFEDGANEGGRTDA